jgi:thioredoxin reductase (NADPH)
VVVVGGGNSAGQAVVYLSGHVGKLWLVVRGGDLRESMSSYLVHRIEQTGNVELLCQTEVERMDGNGQLAEVGLLDKRSGERRKIPTPALFSFIGAVPRTDWLATEVETDAKGFLLTGPGLSSPPRAFGARGPYLLETSRPGVFAAGDVRAGSVKRVASAVGEGAMAVQLVHAYLAER